MIPPQRQSYLETHPEPCETHIIACDPEYDTFRCQKCCLEVSGADVLARRVDGEPILLSIHRVLERAAEVRRKLRALAAK